MSVLRLAIPTPLRREFDYLPPTDTDPEQVAGLQAGVRVLVPFGSRRVCGFLLAVVANSDRSVPELKPAIAILDEKPLLNPPLWELCLWAAQYYHHPIGEVLSAAFPKRLREGKAPPQTGERTWELSTRSKGLAPEALQRSPRQAQAIELLREHGCVSTDQFAAVGIKSGILRSLSGKKLISQVSIAAPASRNSASTRHHRPGLALNEEQTAAVQAVRDSAGSFTCHLLDGVTGSGKTEVYLQLIAHCLAQGRQALVLIPEIGLTPQTVARFQARFDAEIVILHSGLTDAQRYSAWEAARNGSAHIVIGTRSAVFTPLAAPGLIVVDEEHDASFKQQDGFRYCARDVAVKRAHLVACPVLLGSATPSLESLYNAQLGRYQRHRLLQRAGGAEMPRLRCLDVRKLPLQGGLSEAALSAIKKTLESGQQALLFLNRRGWAPSLRCHDCGWIAECESCDARLTVHRKLRQLRCHHCGAGRTLPQHCPSCNSPQLLAAGLGTEQTERLLQQVLPQWPVHRVDSDTMRYREAMQALVEEVNRGEPAILLGTQMLTKGHHFAAVTLVVVVDADALLFSADFRGEERMAQLLTQVAGRAGRAGNTGEVLLQTHYPDHPALQAVLHQRYAEQATAILAVRQSAGLPPMGHMLILRTDCADANTGEQFLAQVRSRTIASLPRQVHIIGPLPSPMPRRAGRHRSQLLITAANRQLAQQSADLLVAQAESQRAVQGLKWSIEVDPREFY